MRKPTTKQPSALPSTSARGSAAASKPPKPHYTGNGLRCCDRCEHAEPHYCRLYSRAMKNMDCNSCRSWQARQNAPGERAVENQEEKMPGAPSVSLQPVVRACGRTHHGAWTPHDYGKSQGHESCHKCKRTWLLRMSGNWTECSYIAGHGARPNDPNSGTAASDPKP